MMKAIIAAAALAIATGTAAHAQNYKRQSPSSYQNQMDVWDAEDRQRKLDRRQQEIERRLQDLEQQTQQLEYDMPRRGMIGERPGRLAAVE
jgi:hypothetical protein